MLTFDELLTEIKRRPPAEQLALLEELAHTLRAELALKIGQETGSKEISSDQALAATKSPEELGWPPGYFESTYGSLRDVAMERPPQGGYEVQIKNWEA
jgi:hypothetical protein